MRLIEKSTGKVYDDVCGFIAEFCERHEHCHDCPLNNPVPAGQSCAEYAEQNIAEVAKQLGLAPCDPTICGILGVSVGEIFSLSEGCSSSILFYINPDGTFTTIPENAIGASIGMMKAIQNPDLVVPAMQKLSSVEKSMLALLHGNPAFGHVELRRNKNGIVSWRQTYDPNGEWQTLFSWLPKNKAVRVTMQGKDGFKCRIISRCNGTKNPSDAKNEGGKYCEQNEKS